MSKCWPPEVTKYRVWGNLPSSHVRINWQHISNKHDASCAIVSLSLWFVWNGHRRNKETLMILAITSSSVHLSGLAVGNTCSI